MTTISLYDDIINLRDVAEAYREIMEAERDLRESRMAAAAAVAREAIFGAHSGVGPTLAAESAAIDALSDAREDNRDAAAIVAAFIADGVVADFDDFCAYADDGPTLIRGGYFAEYAEQLADEIGAIDSDAGWPARYIDWEQAARELSHDYNAVDINGARYWVRNC